MRAWVNRVVIVLAGAGMLVAEPRPAASAPEPKAFRCPEHDPVRQECICTPPQHPDRNAGNEAVCRALAAPRQRSPRDEEGIAAEPGSPPRPDLAPPERSPASPPPSLPPPAPGDRFVGVSLGVPLGLDESAAMVLPRLEITAGKGWRRLGGAVLSVVAIGWCDARSGVQHVGRPGRDAAKVDPAADLTLLGAAVALALRWDGRRVPLLAGLGPAYQQSSGSGARTDQLGLTAFVAASIELRATVRVEWRLSARARVDAYHHGSAGQMAMLSLGPEARF